MPGSAEDFEEAWAQIVADLSADFADGLSRGALERSPDDPAGGSRPLGSVLAEPGEPSSGVPADSEESASDVPGNPDQPSSDVPGDRPRSSPPGSVDGQEGDRSRTPRTGSPPPLLPGPSESPDSAAVIRWDAPTPREEQLGHQANDPGAFVDSWGDEGHYQPPPPPEFPTGTPAKRLAWAGVLGGPATLLLSALTPWDPPPIVALGAGLATVAGFFALVWMLPESREDGWDDGARV